MAELDSWSASMKVTETQQKKFSGINDAGGILMVHQPASTVVVLMHF